LKKLSISFSSGREILKSYWGYLSDGGLVLKRQDLREGQAVMLNLVIEQSHRTQSLSGRVVRTNPIDDASVVALDPGDSGRLLKIALADAPVNVAAQLCDVDDHECDQQVRLLNISDTGCCVCVGDDEAFAVGTEVAVEGPGFTASGCVVWSLGNDRGVIFSTDDDPAARSQLRQYISSVR